jgi:hypothetical protein
MWTQRSKRPIHLLAHLRNMISRRIRRIQNSKILSPKSTSHTNSDSEWENDTFEICKFKGFQILNAILNYLVCNMMKVFTHPTSALDFLFLNPSIVTKKAVRFVLGWNFHYKTQVITLLC